MSGGMANDRLALALEQQFISRLTTAAGATLLVYDVMTSLDQEVKYIWQSQWSSVKILYLWMRYETCVMAGLEMWCCKDLSGNVSREAHQCHRPLGATVWSNNIADLNASAIATAEFWGGRRLIGALLALEYMSLAPMALYYSNRFFKEGTSFHKEGIDGCLGTTQARYLKLAWAVVLLEESTFLLMLLLKTYKSYRGPEILGLSRLFRAILTDGNKVSQLLGILYFVLIVGPYLERATLEAQANRVQTQLSS
ncbi:hypothetical protein CONPUDRAFT_68778 [Coniophora puteana RWD-64-598 SS2]|uniref:DUF6533 domain-containing protein n=1 Tax=Coniophora puteana (strain RWD-64-598) TaxID=741705 RepID=A0A5M3N4F3_CONPW|nr:uncharacterized protein CONPUDRAFT_68778 [Coniophora puteana RWD-64-598 SS2]EIW86188.1 hypothetical protein CONPUDRAFT_68778 [Coniophora puteana RWD-64-598 SS2]